MDDNARIYEDISWLPQTSPPERDRGSSRARTLIGTAAVMAVAGAVGFGGALLVSGSATAASTSTATPATPTLTTTNAVAPQATTRTPTTTSGGS